MPHRTLARTAADDPLLGLVEDRFRLLKCCPACDSQVDEEAFDRRLDELQRRIRRLDERIVRTIATSTPGLLAQLRLLAAFYEESAHGAGRRGSLLIQAIAEGVAQLAGRRSKPPTISARLETSASAGGWEWIQPARRTAPVTTKWTSRQPGSDQTSRSRQSSTEVSASYRAAISPGSGST